MQKCIDELIKEYYRKRYILSEAKRNGNKFLAYIYAQEIEEIKRICFEKYKIIID
ncbi:hypothetical protein [Anoxybacillus flavithermus]|uniref:Uncharacterized protein n=1 Tax=Anoxybacillus mongoliensis TaxID=452565 RepID=A0A7W8N6Q6_9BACL|nr:hypothetical protein [Anoxybacillus flavithermus]MBB5354570.1 hypothetical protein [Anoxybacillus mongoliensis]